MSNKYVILAFLLIVTGCNDNNNTPTPIPTVTALPSPTPTSTPTPTPTITPSPVPTDVPYDGPAEFQPYMNRFVTQGKQYGRNLDTSNVEIDFNDSKLAAYGSSIIGLCETGYGMQRVTIKKSWWDRVSDTQHELLIHHELGHCVLYRGHLSTLLPNGKPVSIMYPQIISSATYNADLNGYRSELFTRSRTYTQALTTDEFVDDFTPQEHICDQTHI